MSSEYVETPGPNGPPGQFAEIVSLAYQFPDEATVLCLATAARVGTVRSPQTSGK